MKLRKLMYTRTYQIFIKGLWKDNPIVTMVLGICSALAITTQVENAIAMGGAVTIVMVASSILVSLLRKVIPDRLRMITYMIIISTFVIAVDQYLKAFFPEISDSLGPYVGLIITNCIIMGRAEAFAIKNKAYYSLVDAFSVGLGYTLIIILVSIIREILAFGTILRFQVLPEWCQKWRVMSMAPGAFIVMAVI